MQSTHWRLAGHWKGLSIAWSALLCTGDSSHLAMRVPSDKPWVPGAGCLPRLAPHPCVTGSLLGAGPSALRARHQIWCCLRRCGR